MKDIIQKLDAEIQSKQPKGILVAIDLFNALAKAGRIAEKQLVFPGTNTPVFTHPMLDEKVFVTPALFDVGEYFRLPPDQSN